VVIGIEQDLQKWDSDSVSSSLDLKPLENLSNTIFCVELSFSVFGQTVPIDHSYELFAALSHFQANLHDLKNLSIQTITSTNFEAGKLRLSKHSKLRIRLPVDQVSLVYPLAGKSLTLASDTVRLGIPSVEMLKPAKNLYSRMVVIKGHQEPESFLEAVQRQLKQLGINQEARISLGANGCLNRKTLKVRKFVIVGFGIEVIGLSDENSLRLQTYGIGAKRKMGCGIFVPQTIYGQK